jgi:indole-3-glycerol phosphate synthase
LAAKQAAGQKFLAILNDPKFYKGSPKKIQKHFSDAQQKELLGK